MKSKSRGICGLHLDGVKASALSWMLLSTFRVGEPCLLICGVRKNGQSYFVSNTSQRERKEKYT